jgi:hypothetical protein
MMMLAWKRILPLFCAAWLAATTSLYSQTLGTVTGQVRDSTGAVIPGVEITVRNTETNVSRSVSTNDDGLYSVPALNPGLYEVKATKTGFKASARGDIQLQVQQTARVDFSLEIGQVSESVEVTGAVPLLTTENATVGTVIEQQRITDLPLNGRNFLSLVALSPNVTFGFNPAAQASGRQGGTRSTITMSLSGSRATWSNYTLDGITNTDINFNLYIVLPSVEALQEFKVQTGIYPAEFGRAAGQVNVSTRGGTNDYHGSVFEFLRNDKLDAKPYFFKDPESPTQVAPGKQPYRQNQYGFTLAGPVRIPKLFNGKNRLFFMANYEGFKSRRTVDTFGTVLTPAMRSGDFSVIATPLQDPATRVKTGTTISSSPFPGNQIPSNRFSKGSQLILDKFSPLPNLTQPGLPNRNYEYNAKTPVDKDQFTGRIDLTESANSQWFGRYSWTDELTVTPGIKLNGQPLYTRAGQWVLANTRVFSSSKVNEARFGYNSLYNNISQELAGVENVNDELGTPVKITDPNSFGIPNISLSNNLTALGNDANGPFTIDDKVYQATDNFSWVLGKHTLRFGGEYRYNQYLQLGNEFARGRFTTNGSFTANANTLAGGYSGADFLMGAFTQLDSAVALAKGDFRNHEWALYADDTYKMTSRLTINWGLRWEVAQPLWDKFGNEVNFQINQPLPYIANDPNVSKHPVYVRSGSGNFYDGIDFRFTGPVQLARDGRLGKRLIKTDYNNFAPRLGIAYSPSNKWSIRTGFGVFFSQESKNSIFDLNRGMGGRASVVPDVQAAPVLSYTNFIDASKLPVLLSSPSGLTWGADSNLATTYTMSYLFNIQRTLGNNSTLEIGYTGNQSRKLAMLINANGPVPGITPFTTRAPYPEWQAIQFITGDGVGNYNALSGKLTQRFGRDFTTLFSFTWSKALDENSAIRGTGDDFTPENPHCRACDMGPSGFNIPRRFVTSILYTLPFGKGKRFLNRGGVVDQIVGGWQFSTITTVQDGTSITTRSWDSAGQAIVPDGNRLNCVAGISQVASAPNPDLYFVPAAFSNTTAGQFGNCGRNNLVAPSQWNVDFSTMKDFRISEKHALQFRMEMFNAPNHPAWGRPSANWGSQNATPSTAFGRIRTTQQLRQIQFALKYYF